MRLILFQIETHTRALIQVKIGTPEQPELRASKMLYLQCEDTTHAEYIGTRAWWPWVYDDETGRYYVHISSAHYITECPVFTGYVDDRTRKVVEAYKIEARRTFLTDRLVPDANRSYDWTTVLSDEWEPRPFQVAGMDRIWYRLNRWKTNVMLADDVGLGKTPQSIGIAERLRHENKLNGKAVLVCTLSSVKSQFADEIVKFARSEPKVVTIDGSRKERLARLEIPADYYVVHYELLELARRYSQGGVNGSAAKLVELVDAMIDRIGLIVCDETHMIRNSDSGRSKAIVAISDRVGCALHFNATPIENGLIDLWTLFRCLDKNALGTKKSVQDRYCTIDEIGRVRSYKRLKEFRGRTCMMYLRRTKRDVGLQCGRVIPSIRPVVITKTQAEQYRAAAGALVQEKGAVAISRIAAMQYAAFATNINDPSARHESAKLDDLLSLLQGELYGERIVLFTRFKQVADMACARLSDYKPMMITGDTKQKDRALARRRFCDEHGAGQILICTEAGDRGLNLQAAGVVGNLDLPWNAAKLRQRVGRVARIGQKRKSILVINWKAVLPDSKFLTIDDYFVNLITNKRGIFNDMFGDDGVDELGDDSDKLDIAAIKHFVEQNQ